MALKTLKDLKIRDEIYFINGNGHVASTKITGVTISEIQFGNEGVFKYNEEDETCFIFEAKSRYDSGKTYYVNKVTALKKRSSNLNEDLINLFENQKGILEKIQEMNKSILETNLEIVKESK